MGHVLQPHETIPELVLVHHPKYKLQVDEYEVLLERNETKMVWKLLLLLGNCKAVKKGDAKKSQWVHYGGQKKGALPMNSHSVKEKSVCYCNRFFLHL